LKILKGVVANHFHDDATQQSAEVLAVDQLGLAIFWGMR
jgi:hypothetical protein